MTLTFSSDGIQVTGTGSQSPYTYIHAGTITITAGMTYVLYDAGYSNPNTAYFYVDSSTAFDVASPGIGAVNYLVAKNSGTYNIYLRTPYNVAINRLYKPMICTKAAFDVSQKYVPYRMSYDNALSLLSYRAPKSTDGTVSSGSMDDFDSGCVFCTTTVTGGPVSNFCYVRTRVYDSNCVLQQAFYPALNTAYQRCKWGGTWSAWKQFVS